MCYPYNHEAGTDEEESAAQAIWENDGTRKEQIAIEYDEFKKSTLYNRALVLDGNKVSLSKRVTTISPTKPPQITFASEVLDSYDALSQNHMCIILTDKAKIDLFGNDEAIVSGLNPEDLDSM